MEAVFAAVLKMSLAGGAVILLILPLRLALRRAPRRFSYLLWAVAAFRLSVPASLPSPLSLFRPRVYVPWGLEGEDLRCALEHERCHLRRGDQWFRLLAWLLRCVLWFLGGLVFLCAVLPPVLIRYPLDTGVPDLTARLAGSRRKAVLAKIVVFFAAVSVLSLLSTLLQIAVYADSIFSRAGFAYVLYTVLLRLLMDMAVLSVPMYLAFLIRSIPGLVTVNAAYGVLCYALCVWASRLDSVVPVPVPAFLHGLRPLWQRGGPALWIGFAVLVSAGCIVLFSALSVRCFEKTREKGTAPGI